MMWFLIGLYVSVVALQVILLLLSKPKWGDHS